MPVLELILLLGGLVLLSELAVHVFAKKLVFFPARYPEGEWPFRSFGNSPQPIDCFFRTAGGVQLHSWYFNKTEAAVTLLLMHGDAGNRSHHPGFVARLQSRLPVPVFFSIAGVTAGASAAQSLCSLPARAGRRYDSGVHLFIRCRHSEKHIPLHSSVVVCRHQTRFAAQNLPRLRAQTFPAGHTQYPDLFGIHGAGHNDPNLVGQKVFYNALENFIMSVITTPDHPARSRPVRLL